MNKKNFELNQIIKTQNSHVKKLKQLEKLLKKLEYIVAQYSRQFNVNNLFSIAHFLKQPNTSLSQLGRSENQIINNLVKLLR